LGVPLLSTAPTKAGRDLRPLIATSLLALRVGVLILVLSTVPRSGGYGFGNDARRYFEIGSTAGRPYRDFEVEVPPLAVFGISVLGGGDAKSLAVHLAIVMLAADIGIALILLRTWGRAVAFRYWLIGTPLCVFIYLRLDLLSVFLAVAAVALARKGRTAAGPTLVAAAFVKVWPLLLLPVLWINGARRAAWAAVMTLALASVAWIAWGGPDGPVQVATFRHSTGWEYQSFIGFLVWQIGGGPLRSEGGSARVGSAPPILTAAMALGLLGISWWTWTRTSHDRRLAEGLGSAVVISALLVFSPVGSLQYVSWLLPWVAISSRDRLRDWAFIATMSAAATALYSGRPIPYSNGIDVVALGLRNAAILVILIAGIVEIRRAPGTVPNESGRLARD
jgi:hypothetical protein